MYGCNYSALQPLRSKTGLSCISFVLVLTVFQNGFSQKQIQESEQTWIGYFSQARFTNSSGLWLDLHYRLTDHYVREKTFAIVRFAYVYHFTERLRVMAGSTYANRFNRTADRVPEHRPWQQVQWIAKNKWSVFTHSLRVEERFRRNVEDDELAPGYNFNWRFRYNVSWTIPLEGKQLTPKTWFLILANDLHLNAGKSIVYNRFDQNRTSLALGYQFTRDLNAHLGHLFILQHQGTPDSFLHIHAIRLYVIHNLDLRNTSRAGTAPGR